ncbi:MAG TPA: HEAT repeat domain-containing protein, partial [Pyrinomonadaceae bacterium]|nr:HEAT repeat domain-containing protein [Pyrinomonadaceae bacterium]
MQLGSYRTTLCALLLLAASFTAATAQQPRANRPVAAIPTNVLLRIMRAEDERRWDDTLPVLFGYKEASVRKRVALAMGRIGDERALPALIEVLNTESDNDVRQMIAFAIGEIESPDSAAALIEILDNTRQPAEVRARAVEALGKIGGALLSSASASGDRGNLPKPEDKPLAKIRTAILNVLEFEAGRRSLPDRQTILLGLTAVLRTKPEGAGPVVTRFLKSTDFRIVADALNTMARLRLKDGNEQVRQLLGNGDAIVRANAARALGAAEDKQAFDALLARALNDYDLRVRVSAIRALGSLKDERAADPLLAKGEALLKPLSARDHPFIDPRNELLEIATTLGRITTTVERERIVDFLRSCRPATNTTAPEIEIAIARQVPNQYWADPAFLIFFKSAYLARSAQVHRPVSSVPWRTVSVLAQGLSEAGSQLSNPVRVDSTGKPDVETARSQTLMKMINMLRGPDLPAKALPDFLRAYSVLKPVDLATVLQKHLENHDVIVRATAAELIGEQPSSEANTRALVAALPIALRDKDLNDAALATLDALAKQNSPAANDAIKIALDSSDHLIRRRAVALLKANGVGDFSNHIGTVKTRNSEADYRRAIARIGKHVTATVLTSKGPFVIEFLPEAAPLTVDNFIRLARKGFFNGQTIPRVVPNFVIQAGDPRGDTNGGPGYQIR